MLDTNTTLRAGDRAGNYQIITMAGAGGMGVVYKALDLKLERTVALKFLPLELSSNEKEKERFLKEARTASSLDHPNIGVIHGVEETSEGRWFIVMAFYEGQSLSQKIRKGLIPFREAVDIAIQMAKGLEAAHGRSIVHRDVKPGNVLITPDGLAKIVDFGLARVVTSASITQTGGTSGTMGYMSPEQSLGKPIDRRTDIWALVVILAEMLTGQNPFWRESVPGIVVAILNDPPKTMEGIPIELQQIVYRALSKDPAHRYQSCAEFRAGLENARNVLAPDVAIDPSALTMSMKSGQFQKYISRASESALSPGIRSRTRAWKRLAGVTVAILALAGIALLAFPSLREQLARTLSGPGEQHIAVLPFDNVGNDPANAPLAEGLMDSLAGKLSDLDVGGKSLWVVPSSEVRHRNISDPTAALRELGATLAVKGSVARHGTDVHLNVNLIDTKNLRQIGTADVDDSSGNLAALQDQVVARLAKLMHVSAPAETAAGGNASGNPAAYESYLKALGYVQRYDTPGNLDLAIAALKQAVQTDPQFALGYAELGEAYRLKNSVDPNPKWIAEATGNCNQALKLNDRLPGPYVTLGLLHADQDKFDLALQEYEHALQLEPHSADALTGTAGTYEKMGRIADAEEAYKKAAALRPDYWDGYNSLGNFYERQGKYPEAIAQLEHAAELTPDNAVVYINLAAAYLDRGDPKDAPAAEAALKKSIAVGPSYQAYANLGILYLNEKRYSESVAVTQKALQLNDKDYLVWANLMSAYQSLNRKPEAAAAREHGIAILEQTVRLKPEDAMTQVSLAAFYAEKGLREKAIPRVQAALARAPEDPNVLELAGETYENLGDRRKALEYIEKALKNGYSLESLKSSPDMQNLLSDPDFRPISK
jgi:serine/threonine-protein kinase